MAQSYATFCLGSGLTQLGFQKTTTPIHFQPVRMRQGETRCLLSWRGAVRLHQGRGTASDFYLVHPMLSEEDEKHYTLSFEPVEPGQMGKKAFPQEEERQEGLLALSFDPARQLYQLILTEGTDSSMTIHLAITVDSYQSSVTFMAMPERRAYNIAVDYGSESIQLLVYNGYTQRVDHVDLFRMKKEEYEGEKELPDDNYLQYEPNQSESERLFRNLCFKMNDGRLVSFSTNKEAEAIITRKEGRLLDNVKVGFLTGAQDVESYMTLLIDMVEHAIRHAGIQEGDIIQLQLLAPNVMPFEIQGLIRRRLLEALAGYSVEIRFFSESDAAFLGYARNNALIPNTNYLIIDSGKGTTDFSVVEVGNCRSYHSLYTGGLIGAGALLSFALLDHIVSLLLNTTDETRRKRFMWKLLHGKSTDLFGRLRLLEAVEYVKRTYGMAFREEENLKGLSELGKEVDSLSAETIANFLYSHPGSYGDGLGIIHATCNRIVDVLLSQLKEAGFLSESGRVDQVILSGRAFRFGLYRRILTERLGEEGLTEDRIFYDSVNAKSQALNGVLDIDRYINANAGIYGQILVKSEFTERTDVGRDFLKRLLVAGSSYLSRFFGFNKIQDKRMVMIDEEFLEEGQEIELSDSEYLSYNGRRFLATDGGRYRLYFTGEHLLLRGKRSVIVMHRPPFISQAERNMIQMSNQSSLMYTPPEEDYVVTSSQLIS